MSFQNQSCSISTMLDIENLQSARSTFWLATGQNRKTLFHIYFKLKYHQSDLDLTQDGE